jgi:hypothetical protein
MHVAAYRGADRPRPVGRSRRMHRRDPLFPAQAPWHLANGYRLQPQVAHEAVDHYLTIDRPAAEEVDRDQIFLWPGVNGQVRLGQDQDQRDGAIGEDHLRGIEHVTAARIDGGRSHAGQPAMRLPGAAARCTCSPVPYRA